MQLEVWLRSRDARLRVVEHQPLRDAARLAERPVERRQRDRQLEVGHDQRPSGPRPRQHEAEEVHCELGRSGDQSLHRSFPVELALEPRRRLEPNAGTGSSALLAPACAHPQLHRLVAAIEARHGQLSMQPARRRLRSRLHQCFEPRHEWIQLARPLRSRPIALRRRRTQDPPHRHARHAGQSRDVPQRVTLPVHQLHVHPDLLSDHPLPPAGRSTRSLGGRAYGVSGRGPGGAPDRGGLLFNYRDGLLSPFVHSAQ